VLIVGAGASGCYAALDFAAAGRETTLSGRDPGSAPRRLLGRDAYWWYYRTGLMARRTHGVFGRLAHAYTGGDFRVGLPRRELIEAGIQWVPRIAGIRNGQPMAGGRVLYPDAVVWATGYRNDYTWIDIPHLMQDRRGQPVHEAGAVRGVPGLYLTGQPLQYRVDSALINGAGYTAAYVAQRMAATAR
jgi:putative flavoprotein involved in K+ transport